MKKIIYHSQDDATNFDLDRFKKSLNAYATISEDEINEALKEFEQYETMHVSCLVEIGLALIAKNKDEAAAKEYFDKHAEYFDGGKFERLRRITGYLVGTLERWNDGKQAEEKARVKHDVASCDCQPVNIAKVCVNSALNDAERLAALENQAMEHNIAYAGHRD